MSFRLILNVLLFAFRVQLADRTLILKAKGVFVCLIALGFF